MLIVNYQSRILQNKQLISTLDINEFSNKEGKFLALNINNVININKYMCTIKALMILVCYNNNA